MGAPPPHRILRGPHLPTIWASLFRTVPKFSTRSERVELSDGDFVDLAWAGNQGGPIVLVLHGLEGSLESSYARAVMLELLTHGYAVALMHFRGCSGEPNRLDRSYHSGDTGDLAEVIQHIERQAGSAPAAVVGYSLGGNVVLKWLGERGAGAPIRAAVAISVPFDLAACADRLNEGFSKIYQRRLVNSMQDKFLRRFRNRRPPVKFSDVREFDTFWAFDDAVTAPLHGFRDVHHYYAESSSRGFLRDVHVPALIVHARDDPFVPERAIPTASELSDSITFELHDTGGHVGFVGQGRLGEPAYWLERRIRTYLDEHCRTSTDPR